MKKWILIISIIFLLAVTGYIIFRIVKPTNNLHTVLEKYGYAELNPASQLPSPGTIVVFDKNQNGVINVVCPCTNAFGDSVSLKYVESPTADISIINELEEDLNFNLDVTKVSGNIGVHSIKKIELRLTNVKILELPDDAVVGLLNNRTSACTKIIKLRKSQGKTITMIKKVIKADAEYRISFDINMSANEKALIMDSLQLQFSGSVKDVATNTIIGKELYWGFSDDAALGQLQPGELPSTGGTESKISDSTKSYKVQIDVVSYDVKPVKQDKNNDCWLAVYTMLKSWSLNKTLSKEDVAKELGEPWLGYFKNNTGLPESSIELFKLTTNLKSEPPANHLPIAYKEFLEKYGPIWITTGNGFSSHARLLVGIHGNKPGELSTFVFIDPMTGSLEEKDFLTFFGEFEKEAKFIVDKRPDLDFRVQVMHY